MTLTPIDTHSCKYKLMQSESNVARGLYDDFFIVEINPTNLATRGGDLKSTGKWTCLDSVVGGIQLTSSALSTRWTDLAKMYPFIMVCVLCSGVR